MKLTDRNAVHIFSLSMPASEAEALKTPEALSSVLGTPLSRPDQAEVLDTADISSMGLTGYLLAGFDVDPEAAAQQRARLDALTGHVLLLRAAALPPGGATLSPAPALTHIATLPELNALPPAMTPLRSDGAKGTLGGGRAAPEPHQASRRTLLIGLIAATVLALVMFLLARPG